MANGDTKDTWTSFGKKINKEIRAAQGSYVKTGFPAGDAYDKPTQDGGPMTVGEIAVIQEFGSSDGRIPERSFIRSAYDKFLGDMRNFLAKKLSEVSAGKITVHQALTQAGAKHTGQIVDHIHSQIPPPNSPVTIAEKGSSTPLIDSGQMVQTIAAQGYEVVDADDAKKGRNE